MHSRSNRLQPSSTSLIVGCQASKSHDRPVRRACCFPPARLYSKIIRSVLQVWKRAICFYPSIFLPGVPRTPRTLILTAHHLLLAGQTAAVGNESSERRSWSTLQPPFRKSYTRSHVYKARHLHSHCLNNHSSCPYLHSLRPPHTALSILRDSIHLPQSLERP